MLLKRQTFTCPCCGGFIGEAASVDEIIASLSPNSRTTIFKLLAKHIGRYVPKNQIMNDLFGYYQPETAAMAVNVYMTHLRKEIAPFGWTIVCQGRTGGRGAEGALYRLIPLEAGA